MSLPVRSNRPASPRVDGRPVGWPPGIFSIAPAHLVAAALLMLGALAPAPAHAADAYRQFLQGLWERGYGDLAVDYVNAQRRRADLPAEIRATIELDLARSLLLAASEATSAEAAARQRSTARSYLEQFKQSHADQPEAAMAELLVGDLKFDHAQEMLRSAQPLSGEGRTTAMEGVRNEFAAARSCFDKAAELLSSRLASMPAPPPPPAEPPPIVETRPSRKTTRPGAKSAKTTTHAATPAEPPAARKPPKPSPRMIVEEQLAEARLKAVLVNYYTAQTFGEADEFSRQAALKAAATGFDDVYQAHRLDRTGLVAHLWSGRIEEELGEKETALDIYDEVLGIVSDNEDQRLAPDVFAVLCEAESRRLRLLDKQGERDAAIAEAEQWLDQFPTAKNGSPDLEIALELCKLKLAKAGTAGKDPEGALARSALRTLADIARRPGAHQGEAVRLWREYSKTGGPQAATPLSDALTMAAAAARNHLWDEAIGGYQRAIAGTHDVADNEKVMSARYELARVQLMAGKLNDALTTASALADDPRAGNVAPAAGLLAARTAWNMFVAADSAGKAAAQQRVEQAARTAVNRWPKTKEADEARLMLAQLQLLGGNLAAALPMLEGVNPSSEHYREALVLAAQIHWRLHLASLKKGPADKTATADKGSLNKAITELETLVRLEGGDAGDDAPPSESLRDALVLLVEIRLAAGEPSLAAPLADRLVAAARLQAAGGKLPATDATALALAIKVYAAQHELAKAGEAAALLLNAGPDDRPVNSALVEYVRALRQSPQSAANQSAANPSKSPEARLPAAGSSASEKTPPLDVLLAKLAARKELSISDRIALGNVCRELSRPGEAVRFYQSALKQVEADTGKRSPQKTRAISQLRLLVVDLLRRERRYDEALAEADRLTADNPGVVEPMLYRAQALDDWSKLAPARLGEAVTAWMRVRTAMQGIQPKPAEYFDAVYNAADCLYRQARETHDPAHLLQAEKVLKGTLVLYPQLRSPQQLEKYQSLLKRIEAAPH